MARRIFLGGKPDEKSPFQGEKCGFDVANAHKFLKISDWYCKMIQNIKNIKKSVDKQGGIVYNRYCCEGHNETKSQNKVLKTTNQLKGSIAQLGEHLPYKQRVTGSSPVVPTNYFVTGKEICLSTIIIILHSRRAELEKFEVIFFNGRVVQLVRTLACHARGRGFEPHSGRHCFASVAQSVEQRTENPRVDGSIPSGSTKCGFSSSGRAPPCQGGVIEFEPRNPLQKSPYDK